MKGAKEGWSASAPARAVLNFLTSPSFSSGCCEVFCLLHGLSWHSEAAAAREWFTDIWSAGAGVPFACCRSSAPFCNDNMSLRPHTHVRTHSSLLIQVDGPSIQHHTMGALYMLAMWQRVLRADRCALLS